LRRHALWAVAALCAALPTQPAHAAAGDQASRRWKTADTCVANATKQAPDHNEAALRKRDQLTNACMKAHGLPPLATIAPADDKPPEPATPPQPK
jgi:hypothetical protein